MLAWLGEELARADYIVAAVNHHGNTSSESSLTAEGFMLWWERATDLSRVVDKLLDDSQFGGLIDPSRIGAGGFSLGGYAVLAVAGARTSLAQWQKFCESPMRDSTCEAQPEFPEMFTAFELVRQDPSVRSSLNRHNDSFRDPRIRAVFAIAPVGSWHTPDSLGAIEVPVRITVGASDRTAPAATNAQRVADLVLGARLTVVDGVGHYTFLAECTAAGRSQRQGLCHEEAGVDRQAAHRTVALEAVSFFKQIFGTR